MNPGAVGFLLIAAGIAGSEILWILAIRPYVRAAREGNQTGANLAVAAWIDWQSCRQLAEERDDPRARRLCGIFAFFQVSIAVGIALLTLHLVTGR